MTRRVSTAARPRAVTARTRKSSGRALPLASERRNNMSMKNIFRGLAATAMATLLLAAPAARAATTLLNVSYDPTRELYQDYNKAFVAYWKQKSGQDVSIRQSHGGSGKQART